MTEKYQNEVFMMLNYNYYKKKYENKDILKKLIKYGKNKFDT